MEPRTSNRPRIGSSNNDAENISCLHVKRVELDPYVTPFAKNQNKGLNISPDIIRLLEENIEIKLLGIGLGSGFFKYDTKAQRKATVNKWDYI